MARYVTDDYGTAKSVPPLLLLLLLRLDREAGSVHHHYQGVAASVAERGI